MVLSKSSDIFKGSSDLCSEEYLLAVLIFLICIRILPFVLVNFGRFVSQYLSVHTKLKLSETHYSDIVKVDSRYLVCFTKNL